MLSMKHSDGRTVTFTLKDDGVVLEARKATSGASKHSLHAKALYETMGVDAYIASQLEALEDQGFEVTSHTLAPASIICVTSDASTLETISAVIPLSTTRFKVVERGDLRDLRARILEAEGLAEIVRHLAIARAMGPAVSWIVVDQPQPMKEIENALQEEQASIPEPLMDRLVILGAVRRRFDFSKVEASSVAIGF